MASVLANFHAFTATSKRGCWECTIAATDKADPATTALWNYSENVYRGRFVESLAVAGLGPQAPVVPGLSKLPAAGEFYASPALSALLKTVPANQLGNRFPGHQIGTIGRAALSSPTELVAIVGSTPSEMLALPGTITVDHINTSPHAEGTTGLYAMAFGIGALMVLFPLLLLVSTATRLAAARREERFAAMRLVGATPRQVNAIASVEAVVGTLLGVVVGLLTFIALRPALARLSVGGQRFFEQTITLTALGYLAMLVVVPIAAAGAALWSLHRVRISPLGVTRKQRRKAPRAWRVLPLLVGVVLFLAPIVKHGGISTNVSKASQASIFVGTFLIMVGLVFGGSWLTMQISRVLGRVVGGPSSLLATRRLADNPKQAFRTVSGLVVAVFVASLIAVIVPTFKTADSTLNDQAASLTNVLRLPLQGNTGNGLTPAQATQLVGALSRINGLATVPIYTNVDQSTEQSSQGAASPSGPGNATAPGNARNDAYDSIVSCQAVAELPALGQCAAGTTGVYANIINNVTTDNPLFIQMPVVDRTNPAAIADSSALPIGMLLVKAPNNATLEQARTVITTFDAASQAGDLTDWQMGRLEAETFGEVAAVRNDDLSNVQNIVLALLALPLVGAACSLAVTVAGSILERRRPFTLMRLSGTSATTLYRVVLIESVLPLLGASVIAALVGIGVAIPFVRALPKLMVHDIPLPSATYCLSLVLGLVAAVAIVLTTLPILKRVTDPGSANVE
jgi:cell division protein FtsX